MSLRVIRKDKELLLFPLLSGILEILILASFFVGAFFAVGFDGLIEGSSQWLLWVFFILFYFVSFFLAIFFNTAIIGCAMIRLNGGNPNLGDGFRIARENLKQIVLWAIFAATVAIIIRAIQQRVGVLGKILLGGIGVAFSVATYFVVPVFIYEKLGPWKALKRSVSILKGTWGEAIVGNLGLGVVFFLLGLAGILPIIAGALIGGLWGGVAGVVIAVVYWIVLGLVASAAQSVLVAALYRYATTGKVSEEFAEISFENPWVVPKRI
jgi:hypothetical protein